MKKPKPRLKSAGAPVATKTASGLDLAAVRELARIAEEFGWPSWRRTPPGGSASRAGARGPWWPTGRPSWRRRPRPPSRSRRRRRSSRRLSRGRSSPRPSWAPSTARPRPTRPSFVEVGTAVRKGQVLCIVEAMKLMNEIEAEAPGKIAEILVKNGEHGGVRPDRCIRDSRHPSRRLARAPSVVQESPHRQPRRDRAPRDPRLPRAGHPDRRGALHRRRRRAARALRRRGDLHRPAAGARRATSTSRRCSAPPRSRGADAIHPGLRLPVRERRVRRGVRAVRHPLASARAPRCIRLMGNKVAPARP